MVCIFVFFMQQSISRALLIFSTSFVDVCTWSSCRLRSTLYDPYELPSNVKGVNSCRFACLVLATVMINLTKYKICKNRRQTKIVTNCPLGMLCYTFLKLMECYVIMQRVRYFTKNELYICIYYTPLVHIKWIFGIWHTP